MSVVICTNLSSSFRTLRRRERQKSNRFYINNLDSPLLKGEATSAASDNGDQLLPPTWLELVSDCNFTLQTIKGLVKQLENEQQKLTLNVFGKKKSDGVVGMTNEIAAGIRRVEKNLDVIGTKGDGYVENVLRQNARGRIAAELLAQCRRFREIASLNNQSSQLELTQPSESAQIEDGFGAQEQVEMGSLNIAERTKRLEQISATVNEIRQMYTQISSMVVEQGSTLDQIDYNVDQFAANCMNFSLELRRAYKRENPRFAIKTVRTLMMVIFVQLFLIVIKLA